MGNPTNFTWVDPTQNVDGSPLNPGEVTGYTIGIRPAAGSAGVYTQTVNVPSPTATQQAISGLGLAAGTYYAAIQTNGPVNSAYSAEIQFTVAATPKAPSGFSAA